MEIYFSLTMFSCTVVTALIMFAAIYPKGWREKKLIFGVKNRDEFRTGDTEAVVDGIVKKRRTQALITVLCICAVAVMLFAARGITLITTVWIAFLFISLVLLEIPYILGNREMKDIKRRLGLSDKTGIAYVDLGTAGAVHALKPLRVWLPTLLGLVPVGAALLTDMGIILHDRSRGTGSFVMTGTVAAAFMIGVLILILSYVFDNLKNEVISADSDINANYNRAKKKNFADLFAASDWINLLSAVLILISYMFGLSGIVMLIAAAVYMLLLFACLAMFVRRSKLIDARYGKEMNMLADDDDHWLLGLFYYNPNDGRMTVEKRVGVGATMNIGHPGGKVIAGLCGLVIIGVLLMIVYLGMTESTPMTIRTENGAVICRQLRDEYVIDFSDIMSAELCSGADSLTTVKNIGTATAAMQKGTFTVDGQAGCRVFLWLKTDSYIKIVTADATYYINGSTEEETQAVYEAIKE
ncbi:MAG: hypothetical protein J6X17_01450, partial [Lachnospiraceae bacterium]|nr:hypothetical protein [Lachnospiraceae bacterium]